MSKHSLLHSVTACINHTKAIGTHISPRHSRCYSISSSIMFSSSPRTSKILDPSIHVGVQDFHTSKSHLPFRVFYPACEHSDHSDKQNVGWFVRSLSYFVDGYMHFISPKLRENMVYRWLVTMVASIVSLFMPLAKSDLPMCKYDAEIPRNGKKYPLIVYSHGLTGTGEEQALTFAYWAQQGYVVAAIHHCDGSSCMVPRPQTNNHLLYQHPDMKNYDADFRPRQVRQRQMELHEMKEYILDNKSSFSSSLRDIVDSSRIIAAGFSYGAATASLEVVTHPNDYTMCILLDGWFHIDVGDGFDFPKETHEKGLSVPTLFIGSAQFATFTGIATATTRLAHDKSSSHVLANSKHQNFCDVGFWFPNWLLKKVGAVGECDFDATYTELLILTKNFLHDNTKHSN